MELGRQLKPMAKGLGGMIVALVALAALPVAAAEEESSQPRECVYFEFKTIDVSLLDPMEMVVIPIYTSGKGVAFSIPTMIPDGRGNGFVLVEGSIECATNADPVSIVACVLDAASELEIRLCF
jgi:hypothetical protein